MDEKLRPIGGWKFPEDYMQRQFQFHRGALEQLLYQLLDEFSMNES
jgi:hypothetical protein